MPKITVDDIEYNTEDLTDNGKAQLASLQFLEVQMKKLQSQKRMVVITLLTITNKILLKKLKILLTI